MQTLFRLFFFVILSQISSVAFAAPFAYITNIIGGTVSVIDTANNTVDHTIPVIGNPYGVAVSPDGSRVYIGSWGSNTLSTIDAVNNTVIGVSVSVGIQPIGVAITPNGNRVYVANFGSHTVSVFDTASNTVIKTIPAGQGAAGVAISPDGSRVYISNFDEHTVSVIDSSSNTVVGPAIAVGASPLGILVSPDGTRLVVANSDSDNVTIIDTATNLVIGTVIVGDRPIDLAITPDSSRVYITHSDNNVVHVVDVASQQVIEVIPVGMRPIGLDITPDGSKVYVANDVSDSVSVIDTCTNTVTNSIGVGDRPFAFGHFISPVDNFIVGGSVSGLTGNVILQNNGTDDLNVNTNCSFSFATTLVDGSAYDVTVLTQPANQICSVTNGSGTIADANVINVSVTCISTYTVGGAITGLISGVTLQNNGADDLNLNADGSFSFATALVDGSAYDVSVLTQATNQICSIANGSGTITGTNVTNVSVTCVSTYTVGGAITGLIGGVTLQNNGADDLNLNADGSFSFATALVDGSAYDVSVLTQATNQICSIANGSGTITGTNVTNVSVTCVSNYTVGGVINGLIGSVTLQNNGANDLNLTADGSFSFATALVDGSSYAVTVLIQPVSQTCTIGNGTGTISGTNITNVSVTCVHHIIPPAKPPTPVPTLSEWSLIMLSILLGFAGFAARGSHKSKKIG